MVVMGWGKDEWGMMDNENGVSFQEDANILKLDSSYECTLL